MTKQINCTKCDKQNIGKYYNIMPDGDDTNTHLCNKCFNNYIRWLDNKE